MRVLFVHKRFPGQFAHLAQAFARMPGAEVVALTEEPGPRIAGFRTIAIAPTRTSRPPTHHYVQSFENAVLLGQAAFRAADALRRSGFVPDLIYAHAGFGPGLYLKEAFPETPLIGHFEWFYRAHGSDADFLDPEGMSPDEALRIGTRNAGILLELAQCDLGLCPTAFQRDQFPAEFHAKLRVVHEGIDTGFFAPSQGRPVSLGTLRLDAMDEIVTYATRGLEPYRGFPQFMQALAILQRSRPGLHAVVAGEDAVHYGRPREDGRTWKEAMLEALPGLDLGRIHFTGALPLEDYRTVLRASQAHVYLSVPFVLSWSLIEAMATGCPIVGSDTAPVREVVAHGETGLLAGFFDPEEIAGRVSEHLDHPDRAAAMGRAARRLARDRYDLGVLLRRHVALAAGLVRDEIPYAPGLSAAESEEPSAIQA